MSATSGLPTATRLRFGTWNDFFAPTLTATEEELAWATRLGSADTSPAAESSPTRTSMAKRAITWASMAWLFGLLKRGPWQHHLPRRLLGCEGRFTSCSHPFNA